MAKELNTPIGISGIEFSNRVMNGAGPIKTLEQVVDLAQSDVGAIVVGSITVEERAGNNGRTYFVAPGGRYSLNSKGLPNPGKEYYEKNLLRMSEAAEDNGKRLIVSVAGFSPEEYAILAEVASNGGASMVELNLGCPNVWLGSGEQKPIPSFHPELAEEIIDRVDEAIGSGSRISVKLSPYSNPEDLIRMVEVINLYPLISAVVSSNTFPNALAVDSRGKTEIEPASGLAGLSGAALKPISLGNVKQIRSALYREIDIIGVGGISTAQDALDFIRVGAVAVQVTTAFIDQGAGVFGRIRNG